MTISIKSHSPSIQHMTQVTVTTPAPREIWSLLMKQDGMALVTQSPGWTDVMCRDAGFRDASRLYEFSDGRKMVLPLVIQGRGFLAAGGSMPEHWGYGGLLSASGIYPNDIAAVWADLQKTGWEKVRIRPNPLQAAVWKQGQPTNVSAVPSLSHILALPGDFSTVWDTQFTSTTRRNIRKAEKSGLVVERDDAGSLVPALYDLFKQSVSRWAEKQHEPSWLAHWRSQRRDPQHKFGTMASTLGAEFRLYMAWYQGEPAAGILVLQGNNAHYTRGVMNKELANLTRANDLLHRLAIEAACEAGCTAYHMGESGDSASLAQFKKRFGAEAVPYASYFWERLPLTKLDQQARSIVKKIIGFHDV
jgi:hypothetical protein